MLKDLNYKAVLLFFIVLLAFILRIYWLDRADMTGDPAHFSFRSINYYDFLNSTQQTTPVQWYGYVPWWSKLSFHEHPPLVFFIQFLFFKLLGVSTFTARLPFVIFGTFSILLVYLVGKKLLRNEILAIVSSFILATINYHLWVSRSGYLEGILIFFILLNIYYFLKLLEKNSASNYLLFGLTLGLAFLGKYTMLFLLPVYFFYLIFHERKILINKRSFFTIITFLAVISPVIIYNLMVYLTRSHLDLQFSVLLGMDISQDWPMFSSAKPGLFTIFFPNILGMFQVLKSAFGAPYLYLFFVSLVVAIINCFYKKITKQFYFLFYFLVFFFFQFTFISPTLRYLSLILCIFPFFLAYFFGEIYLVLKNIKYRHRQMFVILFLIACLFFSGYTLFDSINTNLKSVARKPFNPALRMENYGFRQLELYYNKTIWPDDAAKKSSLLLYETRLNWFGRFWYFYRLGKYEQKKSGSIEYFLDKINNEGIEYWYRQGYTDFYYLKGINANNDFAEKSPAIILMEQKIMEAKLQPEFIYRDDGQVAFEVYYFQ